MNKLIFVFLFLFMCLARTSNATILYAGGEDSDFTCNGSCSVTTTSTQFNAGYAREALQVQDEAASDPPANYWLSPQFTASSILWLHISTYFVIDGGGLTTNAQQIGVLSPDGVARIIVRGGSSNLKISSRNAAGTITDLITASTNCPLSSLYGQDLFINYAVSGEVALYCSGVKVADFTGNVTTDSATQLDQFRLSTPTNISGSEESFSEIIAATTNTVSMRLVTLAPQANGNTDTWDVGGVSNVNETILNDSTVNASGTASQIQLYTVPALPTTNLQIYDLAFSARAQVDTTGPQHMQAVVRTASTNFTSSNISPTQSIFSDTWIDFPTNPNTGVPWTPTDLGAVGFNIGYESVN